jgi:hypothetical protein
MKDARKMDAGELADFWEVRDGVAESQRGCVPATVIVRLGGLRYAFVD